MLRSSNLRTQETNKIMSFNIGTVRNTSGNGSIWNLARPKASVASDASGFLERDELGLTVEPALPKAKDLAGLASSHSPAEPQAGRAGRTGLMTAAALAASLMTGCASMGPATGQDLACTKISKGHGKKHPDVVLCTQKQEGIAHQAGRFVHGVVVAPIVDFGKGAIGH